MAITPKGPLIIELDETALPDAPSPAEAPPLEDPPPATAQALAAAAAPRGSWGIGRWLLAVGTALALFWLGIAVNDFIATLFARQDWLGWIATGLIALFCLLLLVLCLRELAALSRLGRIETIRSDAEVAVKTGSSAPAERALSRLKRLYARRPDLEWAIGSFDRATGDTPDAAGQLALAERTFLAPLDARAQEAVGRAARNVATATALIPLALADVLTALTCNLRMIREIAEIYGGRTGWLGSWRLLRAVAAHLVATGAVAVADDLLGPLVGGGVLGKLSRRFGEGAVNGALTARVGVATMEICRPLPFRELEPPRASQLLMSALGSWRSKTDD